MLIGFILGAYALAFLVSSILTGKLITNFQRGLVVGMVMITLSLVLLGALNFVKDTALFAVLSFAGQVMGGIGAGINTTCSFAIISVVYPKQKELYIGILEAGTGCGLLVGPLLGGGLYHLGGYSMPYLTLASVFFMILPFVIKNGKINFERQT